MGMHASPLALFLTKDVLKVTTIRVESTRPLPTAE